MYVSGFVQMKLKLGKSNKASKVKLTFAKFKTNQI